MPGGAKTNGTYVGLHALSLFGQSSFRKRLASITGTKGDHVKHFFIILIISFTNVIPFVYLFVRLANY